MFCALCCPPLCPSCVVPSFFFYTDPLGFNSSPVSVWPPSVWPRTSHFHLLLLVCSCMHMCVNVCVCVHRQSNSFSESSNFMCQSIILRYLHFSVDPLVFAYITASFSPVTFYSASFCIPHVSPTNHTLYMQISWSSLILICSLFFPPLPHLYSLSGYHLLSYIISADLESDDI